MHGARVLAQILLSLSLAALSWLVPKKRGQLVFYPTFDRTAYGGNLVPVFEHLNASPTKASCLWLTPSPTIAAQLRVCGLPVEPYRLFPLWHLLRAEAIILDSFALSLAFGRFRLFQLWHGTGFKRIGLLNDRRKGLRRWLHRRHYGKYAFVLADSEVDRQRKAESFASSAVFVLGSPRNDVLAAAPVGQVSTTPASAVQTGLLAHLPASFDLLIAYCPTYRETGVAPPFSRHFWLHLEAMLESSHAVLVLKRHPKDKALKVPTGLKRVIDLTEQVSDIQQLLVRADVLVSDYSSVVTDFALTGRPIVFHIADFTAYEAACRTLYFDLKRILPGPFTWTEDALLGHLADRSWANDPAYRRRYEVFRAMFHHHADGRATVRTADKLLELLRG